MELNVICIIEPFVVIKNWTIKKKMFDSIHTITLVAKISTAQPPFSFQNCSKYFIS